MGKRYYCDYCDKTMVASPSIIRTHMKGVAHQKLVNEHYQQYKDPETVLKEESAKKPCSKFARGQCQFGGICRYSHYTPYDLQEIRLIVAAKNNKKKDPETSYKMHNEEQSKTNSTEKNILQFMMKIVLLMFFHGLTTLYLITMKICLQVLRDLKARTLLI